MDTNEVIFDTDTYDLVGSVIAFHIENLKPKIKQSVDIYKRQYKAEKSKANRNQLESQFRAYLQALEDSGVISYSSKGYILKYVGMI